MSDHRPLVAKSDVTTLSGDSRAVFKARCTCRWQGDIAYTTPGDAEVAHGEHLDALAAISAPVLAAGDRVRFDGKATSWLVRATAQGDRYAIATASMFGDVYYTIVDRLAGVRGPLNVIGGGMGICTTSGPDDGIEDTVRRLEARPPVWDVELFDVDPDEWDSSWEVSRRHRLALNITTHIPAASPAARA